MLHASTAPYCLVYKKKRENVSEAGFDFRPLENHQFVIRYPLFYTTRNTHGCVHSHTFHQWNRFPFSYVTVSWTVQIELMQNVAGCARRCQLKVPFVFLSRATHGPPKDRHQKTAVLMEPAHLFVILNFQRVSRFIYTQPNMKDAILAPPNNLAKWLNPTQIQWRPMCNFIHFFCVGGKFPLISTGLECFLGQMWSRFHCMVLLDEGHKENVPDTMNKA